MDPQKGLLLKLNLPTMIAVGALIFSTCGWIFAVENRLTKLETSMNQTAALSEKFQQIVVTLEVVKVKLGNLERKLGLPETSDLSSPKH